MFVVGDVLYDAATAGVFAGVVAVGIAWFWFGLPLWRRTQDG